MKLKPHDKVRITQHAFENDYVFATLVATMGSLGTVLSYEEYSEYAYQHWGDRKSCSEHLALVRGFIEKDTQYPIRLDTVVPPSAEFCAYWEKQGRFSVECEVGDIGIFHVMFLAKIEE